jgi:hypothetical protein
VLCEVRQCGGRSPPVTDVFSHIEIVDGRIWLRPDGVDAFCGDLSEADRKLVWATQAVPYLFTQKLEDRLPLESKLVRGR